MSLLRTHVLAIICVLGLAPAAFAACQKAPGEAVRTCIHTDDELAMETLDRPTNNLAMAGAPTAGKAAQPAKSGAAKPVKADNGRVSPGSVSEDWKVLERTRNLPTQ